MNGQENENQPVRPDFGQPIGENNPAPAALNPQGIGFGGGPAKSEWSPNAVPTPGPINSASGYAPPSQPPFPSKPPREAVPSQGGNVFGSEPPSRAPAPIPEVSRPEPPAIPESKPVARPIPPSVEPSNSPIPSSPSGPEYEIRTMASDKETIKASGGAETAPRSFIPASPSGEPVFNPALGAEAKKSASKKAIVIAIVSIVVIGIGALAFFFIKPLLTAPVVTPPPLPSAIITEEEVAPLSPELPSVAESVTAHSSFFTVAADIVEPKLVEEVSLDSLKAAFVAPEDAVPADASLREIVLSSPSGLLPFSEFISVLLPDMNAEGMKAIFENDFTLFTYRSKLSDLPGFIAKVKPEAVPEVLASVSSAVESSPNLKNLYLSDPGKISAFKSGTINGDPVKYASFASAGLAFDYGWFKNAEEANYLVVSSSFEGMKEAIKRAGF